MSATGHDLHIDQVLSQFAMGYRPTGFIADMIYPIVDVQKQSDLYAIFNRDDALRQQDTKRAPGTEAKVVTRNVGSATYYASNYALKMPVTIEDRTNADPLYVAKLIEGRVQFIMDHLMLDWEIRVANQVTSTSNVGSSAAVSSAWNGAGDVLGNLNTAKDNVEDSNGVPVTDIVAGLPAWRSMRRDSNVRNLIFGTDNGGGYPSREQMANVLEVERFHVGGAYQNTGGEGLAESLSTIWGDNVLLYHRPDSPTLDTPSFAYAIRWAAPGLPNMQVERHPYNGKTKSEEVEVGYYQDEVITGSSYGFLLTAVNSST